jgi:5-deoxy-glucuronate isomerase
MVAEGDRLSVTGDLVCTVVWRPGASVTTRLVAPGDVAVERRGDGPTARIVRTYVGEGAIIAGETINPPGGWSSYPPHRHEHEEVYLYRFEPADGFGVQVRYEADGGDDDAAATVVRDGHVERITSGYHPVVASPHASMYYLWALAGESDRLSPSFDPRYA